MFPSPDYYVVVLVVRNTADIEKAAPKIFRINQRAINDESVLGSHFLDIMRRDHCIVYYLPKGMTH